MLPVGVEGVVDAAADRLALAAVEARLVAPVRTLIGIYLRESFRR